MRDPDTGRGAIRTGEGARGDAALRARWSARHLDPARARDLALPLRHVPADGDRRARGLPRHARRRLRGLGRGRRPARGRRARAAAPPLRRRRAARGVVADVGRDARAAQAGARRRRLARLPGRRAARSLRALAARPPGPAGPRGRAVDRRDAAALQRRDEERRRVRRDPAGRSARPPSVRGVLDDVRGVRACRCEGPRRDRPEDDRVPHERRVAARAGADRGRRGGQAERLPRRAQGALRRAPQHRVVAEARARRRARRLRLPGAEDPPQGDARRAPRGRQHAPVRPHRDRQLPRAQREDLRGLRALHGRPGHRGRRRRPLQPPDGLRQAAGTSARSSSRRSTCASV